MLKYTTSTLWIHALESSLATTYCCNSTVTLEFYHHLIRHLTRLNSARILYSIPASNPATDQILSKRTTVTPMMHCGG